MQDAQSKRKGTASVQSGEGEAAALRPAPHASDRMGTERIGKLLLEFSIPAIVSMVFNSLYNVVDTAFLGQAVGEVGVAVTTLAFPVMSILMGFSMLAGQGGNALAAIQLGEGKRARAERTLGNTFVLLAGIALLVVIATAFLIDQLLLFIGTTEELWAPTKAFVQIICFGFMFQSVGMGLNNFLRTAGKPNLALFTMAFGTVMCIVFNYLFVMVLGFGVEGSASATILGQACGMVPVLWYFICDKGAVFNLRVSCMRPDFRLMGKILSLGVASFVMQVASTAVSVVLNWLLALYGAQDPIGSAGALAAIGVAQKASGFAIMPLIGLIMGAQPLIGYNYGAQNWSRVLKTLKWASIWGVIIGTFFWALSHLIPVQIVGLFGVNGELSDFAVTVLKIYTLFFPIVGFQIVGSSYFQSSGQPLKAAILELTRQILFLIPLYLILPHFASVFGVTNLVMVAICVPVSDALSTAVTSVFVAREIGRLRKRRALASLDAAGAGNASNSENLSGAAPAASADDSSQAASLASATSVANAMSTANSVPAEKSSDVAGAESLQNG